MALAGVAVGWFWAAASPALGDDTFDDVIELLQEKGYLSEQEVRDLKAKKAADAERAAADAEQKAAEEKKATARDFRVYWKDSLRFETGNGKVELRIGGRMQADFAFIALDRDLADFLDTSTTQDGAEVRRGRLYISGTLYDAFDFKFQYDFAGGDADFKDVYVAAKRLPYVQRVQIGHFKEPLSLEELTSSNDITFMERSLANVFSLGRNMGIGTFQTYVDDRVTVAFGAFNDADDFGFGFSSDEFYDLVGRVTGTPLYEDKGKTLVHLGLNYTHRFRGGDVRFRGRPEGHLADYFDDTKSFHASDIDIVMPELAVVLGPFSVQSEVAYAHVQSNELDDPDFYGLYVETSYFLTGEHRPYKASQAKFDRVKPKKNFLTDKGGWGAWQVAARYSRLDLDNSGADGGVLNDLTLGVNWYLNPNMRIMFNYVFSDLESVGDANIFQSRVQLAL
jgi:phosphate-selective porin OprO/OprP